MNFTLGLQKLWSREGVLCLLGTKNPHGAHTDNTEKGRQEVYIWASTRTTLTAV